MSTPERFWLKVARQPDGCWVWTARVDPKGYGRFGVGQSRTALAHRVAYELEVGAIPEGLTLDHLCRNRACVNPAHLEPVTVGENVRRAMALITHCPQRHPYSAENTHINPAGARVCRTCRRERAAARRRAQKQGDEIS